MNKGLWVLGYGSLIYKPPPHYTHRIPAIIFGFMRRFWQSSIDHRGTVTYPGRVANLIPYDDILNNKQFQLELEIFFQGAKVLQERDLTTVGVVYYIPPEFADEVKEYLDVREQNGYTTHQVEVQLEPNQEQLIALKDTLQLLPMDPITNKYILRTTVYIGTIDNEAFVGPESIVETAKVIARAHGPSGSNYVYLKLLCDSLASMPQHTGLTISDTYLPVLLKEVDKLMTQ